MGEPLACRARWWQRDLGDRSRAFTTVEGSINSSAAPFIELHLPATTAQVQETR